MVNHFRTLLLNEPYLGDNTEHIPANFTPVRLSAPLDRFYSLLFPSNASRFYKSFLIHNYLSLIDAAGLNEFVTKVDPRITYDISSNREFFKFTRNTNPVISDNNYELIVSGEFKPSVKGADFYEAILISQVSNTSTVNVFSKVNKSYFLQNQAISFPTPISEVALTGASSTINIGSTGLSFQVIAYQSFTATGNKTWEFIAEAPYKFDFGALYENLQSRYDIVDDMLAIPCDKDSSPENIWKQHYNPVYKIAGLLIAFVNRIV